MITVTVTGTDGSQVDGDYERESVSCNDLISSDSDDWRATGYYCQIDGNYYPLYAMRSSETTGFLWWQETTYTYTWGYSTTDSSSNVTQIGTTQEEDNTRTTPDVTVYSQSVVEAVPASTTITFTAAANAFGETAHVTIGTTDYTINVPEEDLTTIYPLTLENWITNGRV